MDPTGRLNPLHTRIEYHRDGSDAAGRHANRKEPRRALWRQRGSNGSHRMNSTLTGVCLALALTVGGPCALPSWAAAGDPVVVDGHTGFALYGFDPVAYFTDARPAMGRAEFEYAFGGAIWRFRNEG